MTDTKTKKTRQRKPSPITSAQVNALSLAELVELQKDIADKIAERKAELEAQLALIK